MPSEVAEANTNPWTDANDTQTAAPASDDTTTEANTELSSIEDTNSIWSSSKATGSSDSTSVASSSVKHGLLDDLDPYSPVPSTSAAASTSHPSVSQPEVDEKPATPSIISRAGTPSLSFAPISALFRRTPSSSTPPPEEKVRQAPQNQDDPPFDFNRFLEQMRSRSAEPIAKYLRSFLKEFTRRQWSPNEQVRVINDFLDFIAEKMRTNEIWRRATDKEFDNAIEGMEKLVMNRLYHLTFTPALEQASMSNNPTDDLERDHVLSQRIRMFCWIQESHLDLPTSPKPSTSSQPSEEPSGTITPPSRPSSTGSMTKDDYLDFAQRELLKLNQYKAPRDKLITILNCCKVIFGLIRHLKGEEEGADTFIPFLIFVILKANPEHLVSNIQYIQRFRNPERLQGEAGYYLSSLTGAITFIESLDHSALSNITQDEFEHQLEQAILNMQPEPPQRHSSRRKIRPRHSSLPITTEPEPIDEATDRDAPDMQNSFIDPTAATRAFIQRSSEIAQRSMSKPLNAIGKIIGDLNGDNDVQSPTSPVSERRRGYSGSNREPSDYVSEEMSAGAIQQQIDRQAEGQRMAHLATLQQMFPAVDSEIREIILISQQNDIEKAIDALLEMSLDEG